MVDDAGRSSGFLLDSNIIVAAFEEDPEVTRHLAATPSELLFIPAVALGELYFGAMKSRRINANRQRLEEFVAASNVLPVDAATARLYGEVRERLRSTGRPIPENDIWIAATALQGRLALVTRDAHFGHVDGLWTERW
ncbi:MAG: type II toxin-antitoxin system VapC family toxin [Rubrobacter sp.]|nr:type II toxin-antitoxin system VapC family toxin [Rubrobacter sp.]